MQDNSISAIITTTGRASLERAIHSVRSQTLTVSEIIVVLDSKNSNMQLQNELNLKVIDVTGLHNVNESRNIGVRAAQSKYVAFLDDDDEWLPEKIEKQLEFANENESNSQVFYTQEWLCKSKKTEGPIPERGINGNEPILNYVLNRFSNGFVQTSSIFALKELMVKYPFIENKDVLHDEWEWISMLQKNNIDINLLKEPLVNYTVNESSTSLGTQNRWRENEMFLLSHRDEIKASSFQFGLCALVFGSLAEDSEISLWNRTKLFWQKIFIYRHFGSVNFVVSLFKYLRAVVNSMSTREQV